MSDQNLRNFGDKFSTTFGIAAPVALILAVLMLIGYPIFRAIAASGQIEYCYVSTSVWTVPNQPNVVMYYLYGFRSWRSDRIIAQNLVSMDEVRTSAQKYGCELK